MWMFEKKGFVSVVAYDPAKDREKDSPFKKRVKKAGTHLLVRARIKDDLNSLMEIVPSLEVDTQPHADYAYRCVVTRAQFKKYMNKIVDGIDYDSHFKEECRDNAPPVAGRYSALMSTWTIWANLQDTRPYGGYFGSGYSDWWGGHDDTAGKSTSKSKPYTSPFGSDANKTPHVKAKNFDSLPAYRRGESDPHGLAVDDTVTGYFGVGVVTKVEPRVNEPDLVHVSYKNKASVQTNGRFLSTYLHKGIYEEPKDEVIEGVIVGETDEDEQFEHAGWINRNLDEQKDLEWAYAFLIANPVLEDLVEDVGLTDTFDDEAWELVMVLDALPDSEWGDKGEVPEKVLTKHYREVKWSFANDQGKRQMIADGEVPEGFEQEALTMLDEA